MAEDIVVLGGGPAGVACAYELFKAGRDCVLLERFSRVGGLAETFVFDGDFRTDVGSHRFL